MKSADFAKMFTGKLKPTTAFMTGKLKIAGNMGKAMALEKLMGKMQKRGFHSLANRTPLGDVTNYDGKESNTLKSRL